MCRAGLKMWNIHVSCLLNCLENLHNLVINSLVWSLRLLALVLGLFTYNQLMAALNSFLKYKTLRFISHQMYALSVTQERYSWSLKGGIEFKSFPDFLCFFPLCLGNVCIISGPSLKHLFHHMCTVYFHLFGNVS